MAESRVQDIVIKNGSGKNADLLIHAKLDGTLLDLKKNLQEQYPGSPAPYRQTLIHAGKVLKDEQAPLHMLLRRDLEPSSGPISLHLVVKAEAQQSSPAAAAAAADGAGASSAAANPAHAQPALSAAEPSPGLPETTPGQPSSGSAADGEAQSATGDPLQGGSGGSSGDGSSGTTGSGGSGGGSLSEEAARNRWYDQQHAQYWRQHSAASDQHPAASAQMRQPLGVSAASAPAGGIPYAAPYAVSYGQQYVPPFGPQYGQQYGQQYTMPYSLPPPAPLQPYAFMPQPPPPASQGSSQPVAWQPYTPALSAAYSAAMASLSDPAGASASASASASTGAPASIEAPASLGASASTPVRGLEGTERVAADSLHADSIGGGASGLAPSATTAAASTAGMGGAADRAPEPTRNGRSESQEGPSSAGNTNTHASNSSGGTSSSGSGGGSGGGAAAQFPPGGLAAAVTAGGFPIVALVPVGMLNGLGLQPQQQQQGGRLGDQPGVTGVRQSAALSQPSDQPPPQPPMFLQLPLAPPAAAFNFSHPGAAGPPWSGAQPVPTGNGPWGSAALPPPPVSPPFPPPPGFYPGGLQFRGAQHQQTGSSGTPGGAPPQPGHQEAGQRFPPGGGVLPDGRPLAPFPADAAAAAGWQPIRQGGARRRRHGGGGNDPVQPPQGLHMVAQLRHPGVAGGGGQPQVRGFQIHFNINMRVMLQVGVILVLLYQHCPPGRFFALVIGGALLWFSAFSPLRRRMQRFIGSLHRGGAPAAPANGPPAGAAPGGPAPGVAADGDQQGAPQTGGVVPQRASILREVFALLVGFFTSLLPGWNLNPEDAAAFAAAQQAAAAEAARAAREAAAAAAAP